ncbi:hypothetical protein [Desulfoluna butyratoxydans]|uniref:Sodium/calcium exchanger membrane region n=1 Tax=Desulfoluna butyratoxydans TaxID=231438 RepID=A0A4U8YHE7_9BACT|nr:hypothetical protein [Desulfoluna butyratoxydans]VFQ42986.1 sodium/calcium exchanger membrane region [Desulfoluna butyratoxydans]
MDNILDYCARLLSGLMALLATPNYTAIFKSVLAAGSHAGPWQLLGLFLVSSMVMVWRLNAFEKRGFEGTAIGTMVMPYCSGFSNLAFAYVMGTTGGDAAMVLENCIVNNVTNLTILLGIPALLWGLTLKGTKEDRSEEKLDYLSLLLTLIAMVFFTAVTWALGRDGVLNQGDGLVLMGLFLFWQVFQVFDVMKTNVQKHRAVSLWVVVDILLVGGAAWGTYVSIEGLVAWVSAGGGGIISTSQIGILSGLLMVVPNGLLAFYYAAVDRSDIAYSSQIGDGHICIPMCIGIFAFFSPIRIPDSFETGAFTIMAACAVHFFFVGAMKRLPRGAGAVLAASYGYFIYKGILM